MIALIKLNEQTVTQSVTRSLFRLEYVLYILKVYVALKLSVVYKLGCHVNISTQLGIFEKQQTTEQRFKDTFRDFHHQASKQFHSWNKRRS